MEILHNMALAENQAAAGGKGKGKGGGAKGAEQADEQPGVVRFVDTAKHEETYDKVRVCAGEGRGAVLVVPPVALPPCELDGGNRQHRGCNGGHAPAVCVPPSLSSLCLLRCLPQVRAYQETGKKRYP